jgi:hypothetical protein
MTKAKAARSGLSAEDPRVLPVRTRQFIEHFTNPSSEGFMNATRAMLLAAPEKTYGGAAVLACNLKKDPGVQQGIRQALEASGLGFEKRAEVLDQVMNNPDVGKTIMLSTKDEEGRLVMAKQSGPTWGHVLKAVELGNKLSGDYEHSKQEANLADTEYRALLKRHFPDPTGNPTGKGYKGKPNRIVMPSPDAPADSQLDKNSAAPEEANKGGYK